MCIRDSHSAASHSLLQMTNATTGGSAGDGAYFGILNGEKTFRIYNFEDAPINFYTNNLTRLSVANTGNIGIGTETPTTRLDVVGAAKATAFSLPATADAAT